MKLDPQARVICFVTSEERVLWQVAHSERLGKDVWVKSDDQQGLWSET